MLKREEMRTGTSCRVQTDCRRFSGLVSAVLILSAVLTGTSEAATHASRFDPADFASLGTLNASSGTITFNTDTLTATGFPSGVVGVTASGSTQVAVFTFDSINLSGTATVTVLGARPIALLSRSSIVIGAPLRVDGSRSTGPTGGTASAGGYAGGNGGANGNGPGAGRYRSADAGSGAGYGGAGGQGADANTGGPAYGDALITEIAGGSGGGGGGSGNAGGGGGGGAIELSAAVSITIEASGLISATGGDGYTVPSANMYPGGGGSGGAVLLNAPTILNQGSVLAKGGEGGDAPAGGSYDGGGGGGGGRVAVYADVLTAGTISVAGGIGGTADNPGSAGSTGTVHIHAPTPPTAANGTASGTDDAATEITLSATDDGLPDPPAALTYTVVSLPTNGSLEEPGVGAITSVPHTLAAGAKIVKYTANTGYSGSDSFTFKANDGGTPPAGGDSNIATVTINVVSCTVPAAPTTPVPADGAVSVDLNADLSWAISTSSLVSSEEVAPVIDPNLEWWKAEEPHDFCATEERYLARVLSMGWTEDTALCATQGTCDAPTERDMHVPDAGTPIKTYRMSIHVFCDDSGTNCAATQASVDAQMVTVNEDYLPWRIQVVYETEFINSTLYRYWTPSEEAGMKSAYADTPAEKLNVFVVNNSSSYSVATFPWDPDALTYIGGIVMHEPMFGPGVHTLTHEIGHCIGLWHTHHGVSEVSGCSDCHELAGGSNGDYTGDFCSQTDPTPTNYSCAAPGGSDSCNGVAWGTTDFHNYMGYAPSSCRSEFVSQQAGRFHCWSEQVLTGWLAPGSTTCPVTYDVYFDTVNPPVQKLCSDVSTLKCDPGSLDLATTYYWKVVAKSAKGTTEGPVWTFTTRLCAPVGAPNNPDPVNGAVNVPVDKVLGWNAPSACYEENFDDGLAQGWIEDVDADWNIVSQQYVASNTASSSMIATYGDQVWSDVRYEVKNRASSTSVNARYMLIRASADFETSPTQKGTGYAFGHSSGSYYIFKLVNGVSTILQTWASTSALKPTTEWNTLTVEAVGASLKFYINGTLVWTGTDATIPSGRVGLLGYSSGGGQHFFDDIKVCLPGVSLSDSVDTLQAWYNEHPTGGGDPAGPNGEAAPVPPSDLTNRGTAAACDVTYDVYLGTTNPPTTKIGSDLTAPPCQPPAALAKGVVYYWKVVAKNAGGSTDGPVWSFRTVPDCPPVTAPTSPTPADTATDVPVDTRLSWASGTSAEESASAADVQAVVDGLIQRSGILEGPLMEPSTGSDGEKPIPITRPEQVANMVTAASLGINAASALNVAVVGANSGPGLIDVQNKLLATGQFSSVTIINTSVVTPTLTELQAFRAITVHNNYSYANRDALGNVVADYVDGGGGVVCMVFEVCSSASMGGRWASATYRLMDQGAYTTGHATLGTIQLPSHPIMAGVGTFDGGSTSWRPALTTIYAGVTRVADWSDGRPLVLVKPMASGAFRADVGFYPLSLDAISGGWLPTTDGAKLLANALTYVAGGGPCATTYDVYLGTTNPPTSQVASALTSPSWQPLSALANSTTYYWKVVAKNALGEAAGPVWSFATVACSPPSAPNSPQPSDGAVDVAVNTSLSWASRASEATGVEAAVASMIERSGVLSGPITVPGGPSADGSVVESQLITLPDQVASVEYASSLGIDAAGQPNVLLAQGDYPLANAQDVRNKLLATGKFASVAIIDGRTVSPTLTELQAYNAVLVWSQTNYKDQLALGNAMADYVDSGGGVVCAVFEVAGGSCCLMTGRWDSQGYYVIPRSSPVSGTSATLGTVHVPGHPLLEGVTRFSGGSSSFRPTATTLSSGVIRIADWSDGRPLVATKTIGTTRRVDLGFYPPSNALSSNWWDATTDGALLMANALTYVASGSGCSSTYDVFFDTNNPPTTKVAANLEVSSWKPASALANGTTYYWKVVARRAGVEVAGPVWSFKTVVPCAAPAAPSQPVPLGGAINVPTNTTLSWGLPAASGFVIGTSVSELNNGQPEVALSGTADEVSATGFNWLVVGASRTNINQAATVLGATVTVTTNFTSASLTGIKVLIFHDGSSGYFVRDSVTTAKLSAFVQAGGGLYVEIGGSYPSGDYSWIPISGIVSTPINIPSTDLVSIVAPSHPIAAGVTDVSLDNWGISAHGDFTAIANLVPIFSNTTTSKPVTIAGSYGAGKIICSNLDPTSTAHVHAAAQLVLKNAMEWLQSGTSCSTTYDVYLDKVNPPTAKIGSNLAAPPCQPLTALEENTTYYWKVVAKTSGGETAGPVWSFRTLSSCPIAPMPENPSPAQGAVSVPVDSKLSWTVAAASFGAPRTAEQMEQLAAQFLAAPPVENGGSMPTISPYSAEAIESAATGTVKILAFTGHSDNSVGGEYENTVNAISQHFKDFTITRTTTEAAPNLTAELVGKDVFLVPEQESWSSGAMTSWGTSIASVLQAFANGGGVVIAADDGDGGRSDLFLKAAGLLTVGPASTPYYSTRPCAVAMPSHPIMNGVPATFNVMNGNTTYPGTTDGRILANAASAPIVVAKEIGAGGVVLMGYDFYEYNTDMARVLANAVQWTGATATCPTLYDVYLDTVNPPVTKVAADLTKPPYKPASPLAEATPYFWKVVSKNARGQTESPVWSFATEYDFNYQVVVLDAPSGSGTNTLPTSVSGVSQNAPFYVELWARDEGILNTGLSCVFADLEYTSNTVEVLEIIPVAPFDMFGASGTDVSGKVDELGGCTFDAAVGVKPGWACVARLKMQVKRDPCSKGGGCDQQATFTLKPASGESSAYGRGTVPVDKISYGQKVVDVQRYCLYDLSHDCLISAPDMGLFAPSWLKSSGQPGYKLEADFDCSGSVGGGDIGWFATAWLKSCGAAGIVYPACQCSYGTADVTVDGKVQLTYRIRPQLVGAETATDLPVTPIVWLGTGETCYVEVWARDLAVGTQGLAAVLTDLTIESDGLKPISVIASTAFGMLPSGSVQSNKVLQLGGATLTPGMGAGSWVRVATVKLEASKDVGVSPAVVKLTPTAGDPVGRIGSGTVPLTSIDVCPNLGADLDGDCAVESDDCAAFTGCISGPGVPQPQVGCAVVDFDLDGDVDQSDFGKFQRCLTGPEQPIDVSCLQE